MTTPNTLPQKLSKYLTKDGRDWLVSVLDPFHDFERSIEGAPDHLSARSFTRRYTQTATVSAVSDDDNITLEFYGNHGIAGMFSDFGVDGYPDDLATGVEVHPITVYNSPSGTVGSIGTYLNTTATKLVGFNTTQEPEVPSRLISMGIEITDITPSLYKKGTIYCVHPNGEVEDWCVPVHTATDVGDSHFNPAYMKPSIPITSAQMSQLPGAYIGKMSEGIYTQARLNKIAKPRRHRFTNFGGAMTGAYGKHPVIAYAETVAPRIQMYQPTVDSGDLLTLASFVQRDVQTDSGFQPIRILCSGLAMETTLQISVKCVVEYFPQATHLFESGIATWSPDFDPVAMLLYHEIVRQLPGGVPVGYNAAGDFWRMVLTAAKRIADMAGKYAPPLLSGVSAVATAAGHPEIALAADTASRVVRRVAERRQRPMARPRNSRK